MLKSIATVLATGLIAGYATTLPVSDGARSELAPTGTLRAGMNLGNTLFTTKDSTTGQLRGVSVDLMRELASPSIVSSNRLNREFTVDEPDRVWVPA